MEGCIHHPSWSFRTNRHVLRILQCSQHFSGLHESYFHWYDCRTLTQNLHGWPRTLHHRYPQTPSWTNMPRPPTPAWTQSFSQTLQMCLWHPLHGIPWSHHWQWTGQDGSSQTIYHQHMETPHLRQGSPFLPWFHKFLLEVHTDYSNILNPLTFLTKKD